MNLYQLRDIQKATMTPLYLAAWTGRQALDNPLFTLLQNELTKNFSTKLALLEKHIRVHNKPTINLTNIIFRGADLAVREEIILNHPFANLIHFTRTAKNKTAQQHIDGDPKLLIVAPLSGHFSSILRGTIESMLSSHDVYIADWIDAKKIPITAGRFNLEDQISLLADMIRYIGPDVHVMAVTQASFATLSAVALLSGDNTSTAPLTLTMMGGPIDPRKSFVQLKDNAQKHSLEWFEENHIQHVPPYYIGAMRLVYPGFLQLQNQMELVLNNSSTEIVKYFHHLVRGDEESEDAHERLYDDFLAVMDVPAELYLQYIEYAYYKCALATGTMECHGKEINLNAIKKTALLTIEAELDDLSPPGQTSAGLKLCSNLPDEKKQSHLEIGVGHYGVFCGKKWRNNIQPIIHDFIRKNC